MLIRNLVLLSLLVSAESFVPAPALKPAMLRPDGRCPLSAAAAKTKNEENDNDVENNKRKSLDTAVRSKLLAESIAPWRTLRLFAYGALGSGAALGGLVTLSGVAAGLSGARTDVDLNTEYLNLAIDFGAAAAFAVLAKLDFDKGAELNEKVDEKIARTRENKQVFKAMKERERALSKLNVEFQASVDGQRQAASVGAIQAGGKQHIILVAGSRKACKDALLGASLLKMDFAMSNILVVPYQLDEEETETQTRPEGSGFGDQPIYETQPYVANPVGEGWEDYVEAEMEDAVKQSGERARGEGIAVVIANNGEVIRRGVGRVPWRQMVQQLEESISGKKEESLF